MAEVEDAARCPSCGEMAAPEQDDTLLYWSCACGYDFGYRTVQQEQTCAAGIPLSQFATGGIIPNDPGPHGDSVPVFLGSTIARRPQ